MMGFVVDYDKANQSLLLPEGSYEMVCVEIDEEGDKCLHFELQVRDDVSSQSVYKGQILHSRVFRSKANNKYHPGMLQSIAKAFKLPNGKEYNSIPAFLNDMRGKPVKVTVEHRKYKDKIYANVSHWDMTDYPDLKTEIVDTEIPF